MIKQNYEGVFNVKWPENILWPEKEPVQVTATANAIDLFRFQKYPNPTISQLRQSKKTININN